MKKIALIVVCAMSVAASGANLDFYPNASGDGISFSDVNNWIDVTSNDDIYPPTADPGNFYPGTLPDSIDDRAYIRDNATVTVGVGDVLDVYRIYVGGADDYSTGGVGGGPSTLNISGGLLTIQNEIYVGDDYDGTLNQTGGTAICPDDFRMGQAGRLDGRYGEFNLTGGTWFDQRRHYWGRYKGNTAVFNLDGGVFMASSGNPGYQGGSCWMNIMSGTYNARDFWAGGSYDVDLDDDGINDVRDVGEAYINLHGGQLDWRGLAANGGWNLLGSKAEIIVHDTFNTPDIDGVNGARVWVPSWSNGGSMLRFEVGATTSGLLDLHGYIDMALGGIDIIDTGGSSLAPGTVVVLAVTRDWNSGANPASMTIPQVILDAYNFSPGAIGQLSVQTVTDAAEGDGVRQELWLTIPEPATMSLLALGGLALIRRRK
jgi:hypothetical protein